MQKRHTEEFLSLHLQAMERFWHSWVSVGSESPRDTQQHISPLPSPLPEDPEMIVFKSLSPVLPTTGIILPGDFGELICCIYLSSLLPQLNACKRAFLLLLHFSFRIKISHSQCMVLLLKVMLSRFQWSQYLLKLLNSCRSRKILCLQVCSKALHAVLGSFSFQSTIVSLVLLTLNSHILSIMVCTAILRYLPSRS